MDGEEPQPGPGVFAELEVGMHRLALLRDGEQAFPAMLEAIRAARTSVCLESYTVRSDRMGERFADALIERSLAGVEVNLIYDAWGSSVSAAWLQRLHEAGIRTVAFHPLAWDGRVGRLLSPTRAAQVRSSLPPRAGGILSQALSRLMRRDHRKILVVDQVVGFTGGLNIADDYAPAAQGGGGWRDTQIRIEGPAVNELFFYFLTVWRQQGGAPLDPGRYRNEARSPDPKVRILASGLRQERKQIQEAYLQAIKGARRRILITSAYFVPTTRMLKALKSAARRGVAVELMLAGTTDIPPARFAAQSFYGSLLTAGARIYEWYGRVLHAKTAVVDGSWGTVGSTNLDTLSLRMNLEVNAVFDDEGFASAMEKMFDEDLEQCVEIHLDDWRRRSWGARLVSWFIGRFRRWL